ncbi:hypothetical protein HRbin04_00089 [archaeon HR04]|nr:hypothetical protein HRbin04_00089 [archaeon HR04]
MKHLTITIGEKEGKIGIRMTVLLVIVAGVLGAMFVVSVSYFINVIKMNNYATTIKSLLMNAS